MLTVLECVVYAHDLRLVALSAVICALGCYTVTSLVARAGETHKRLNRWLVMAALVFGCSVWSLHFVAMLAFMPGQAMAYDVRLTVLSIAVASSGALLALLAWRAPIGRWGAVAGGVLLGLAVAGMHYLGVAAMTFSGHMLFQQSYVIASIVVSVTFSVVALFRANDLRGPGRRLEVAGWLSLSICGLHFTGMAAITMSPGGAEAAGGTVLGTATLAVAVGSVSVVILIASLAAVMIDQLMSQRVLRDLDRMRLMSNLAQEVLIIHCDGIVLEVNTAGERLFKKPAKDIIGRAVVSLFTSDSAPALLHHEHSSLESQRSQEVTFRAIDGSQIPVELTCQPIDYLGKSAAILSLRDLTDHKRHEERIHHLARHDALTHLPNRYALIERLGSALELAARQTSAVAVVYIDLDRFKLVNDALGHASGDALLVQASNRILHEIRASDTLARIGGDEFIMILDHDPRVEQVSIVATRIIEALRKPFEVEGHRIEIGVTIGVAFYPDDAGSVDTLMRAADIAMYRGKAEGRGTLRFYEASMNEALQLRLELEQELAAAIDRNELVLHYQPIVNGVTGQIETFEALIRWNHPRRGMVAPLDFIPLAEQTGLIIPIGRWVIETACREAASWTTPWRVSLNVSPKQFRQSDVCEAISAALQANALDPKRIVVEVTESILIDDTLTAVATLNRLRQMGVRVALDDFGTGYSSLSYLQLFQFDKFKIDKSFIKKLDQNDDVLTITRSIINLGHNLGLQVTAEGVETEAQLKILQAFGCDQIQGYLVAKPAPIDSFTELDRRRTEALFEADRLRLSA